MAELQSLRKEHEAVLAQIHELENEAFVQALSVASSWKIREEYRDTVNQSLMAGIRKRLKVESTVYLKLGERLGVIMTEIRKGVEHA